MLIKKLQFAGFNFGQLPADLSASVEMINEAAVPSEKLEVLDKVTFEAIQKLFPTDKAVLEIALARQKEPVAENDGFNTEPKDAETKFILNDKTMPEQKKNGGDVTVHLNEEATGAADYSAVLGDIDKDSIDNADDPNPTRKGDKSSIEQTKLADALQKIINVKNSLDIIMNEFVPKLTEHAPEGSQIYARTKTPYSIINKLIDKRLIVEGDPKRGLTDLIGTTIAVKDYKDLQAIRAKLSTGELGEVLEEEDMYVTPKNGYKAVHYILLIPSASGKIPVEVQLKTARMKEINQLSHDAYKQKNLNADRMLELTAWADKADKGDAQAEHTYKQIMQDKAAVKESLYAKKMEEGGLAGFSTLFTDTDEQIKKAAQNTYVPNNGFHKFNFHGAATGLPDGAFKPEWGIMSVLQDAGATLRTTKHKGALQIDYKGKTFFINDNGGEFNIYADTFDNNIRFNNVASDTTAGKVGSLIIAAIDNEIEDAPDAEGFEYVEVYQAAKAQIPTGYIFDFSKAGILEETLKSLLRSNGASHVMNAGFNNGIYFSYRGKRFLVFDNTDGAFKLDCTKPAVFIKEMPFGSSRLHSLVMRILSYCDLFVTEKITGTPIEGALDEGQDATGDYPADVIKQGDISNNLRSKIWETIHHVKTSDKKMAAGGTLAQENLEAYLHHIRYPRVQRLTHFSKHSDFLVMMMDIIDATPEFLEVFKKVATSAVDGFLSRSYGYGKEESALVKGITSKTYFWEQLKEKSPRSFDGYGAAHFPPSSHETAAKLILAGILGEFEIDNRSLNKYLLNDNLKKEIDDYSAERGKGKFAVMLNNKGYEDGGGVGHWADDLLKGNFDISRLTDAQKELIVQPFEAPENYYQDGELKEKEARALWKQKLLTSGLNNTDIARALVMNSPALPFGEGGEIDVWKLDESDLDQQLADLQYSDSQLSNMTDIEKRLQLQEFYDLAYAQGGKLDEKYKRGDFVFASIYNDPNAKVPFIVSHWSHDRYYVLGDGSHYVKEENLLPATEKEFDEYYGANAKSFKQELIDAKVGDIIQRGVGYFYKVLRLWDGFESGRSDLPVVWGEIQRVDKNGELLKSDRPDKVILKFKYETGGEVKVTHRSEKGTYQGSDVDRRNNRYMHKIYYPILGFSEQVETSLIAPESREVIPIMYRRPVATEHVNYEILKPAPLKPIGWLEVKNMRGGGLQIFEATDWDKTNGAEFRVGTGYSDQYIFDEYNKKLRQNPLFWSRPAKKIFAKTLLTMGEDETWESGERLPFVSITIDRNKQWSSNHGLSQWAEHQRSINPSFKRDFEKGGTIHSELDGGELLFHAATRGGKWTVDVLKNRNGNYEIQDYKNGSQMGYSGFAKEEDMVKRLTQLLQGARDFDGINYIIAIDKIGIDQYATGGTVYSAADKKRLKEIREKLLDIGRTLTAVFDNPAASFTKAGAEQIDKEDKALRAEEEAILAKYKAPAKDITDGFTNLLATRYKNPYELNRAIETLLDKKNSDNPADYTSEEKRFISLYSGMGGLEKYGAKGGGLMYEYYTPDLIVQKMWGLAYKHGFNDGNVLEPSIGVGAFLKYANENCHVTGFEINKYSYTICKILFPHAQLYHKAFEQRFIKGNDTVRDKVFGNTDMNAHTQKFDLVIGNPPYAAFDSRWAGMGEKQYTQATSYVEYFITRGLDLLKTDGLLIYIIGVEVAAGGKPFLSTGMTKAKAAIAEKAELVEAYRLPNGVFERTDVVSDIIVFKKK